MSDGFMKIWPSAAFSASTGTPVQKRPKMSVRLMCYNQEKYIAQAVESILAQQVDFEMEIVVGDDFSTDNTLQIVLSYAQQHPHLFNILKRKSGDSYYQQRQKYGRLYNCVDILNHCRGEYIALLDGDDYWTSPNKLQKQVDFLDGHPNFVICFHPVKIILEEDTSVSSTIPVDYIKQISTIEDLVVENFIPTCSTIFRSGLFEAFPEWFFTLNQGDWSLHILNAQHGDIGYINKEMAVYRIHSGGAWTREKLTRRIDTVITTYNTINKHFNFKYDKLIKPRIAEYYFEMYKLYESAGEMKKAKQCLSNYISISFPINFNYDKLIKPRIAEYYFEMYKLYESAGEIKKAKQYLLKYISISFPKTAGRAYDLFVLIVKLYFPFLFKIIANILKKLRNNDQTISC